MKKMPVPLFLLLASGSVLADERSTLNANIGVQVGTEPAAYAEKLLDVIELTITDDIAAKLVGNAEINYKFGGESSDRFGLFASYNLGPLQHEYEGIVIGAELLNYGDHNLDIMIGNFSVYHRADEGISSSGEYSLNYSYQNEDWNVAARVSNEWRTNTGVIEGDPSLLRASLSAHKSIFLPKLHNSELVLGSNVTVSSKDHGNYLFGVNDGNRDEEGYEDLNNYSVDFAASATVNATLLVPLTEHWLFTSNIEKEFLSKDLKASPVLKDHSRWNVSSGMRYVF